MLITLSETTHGLVTGLLIWLVQRYLVLLKEYCMSKDS